MSTLLLSHAKMLATMASRQAQFRMGASKSRITSFARWGHPPRCSK